MKSAPCEIVVLDDAQHREQVVALWQRVFGYETAHNAPELAIDKKVAHGDGLFFVVLAGKMVTGTIMAGYDGHRGWICLLAIRPEFQRQGIGSALLTFAQEKLAELGCLKVNLQIVAGNEAVQGFCAANGFSVEERISMGKELY